jgi:hypothetical protein
MEGTRRISSPIWRRLVAPETPSLPCSSEARSEVAAGSSQTSGGPESKASALRRASTIVRSSAGRFIAVAQPKGSARRPWSRRRRGRGCGRNRRGGSECAVPNVS